MDKKVKAAMSVYEKKYNNVTAEELKDLGFEGEPSKEYLREAVLETLAADYMEIMAY